MMVRWRGQRNVQVGAASKRAHAGNERPRDPTALLRSTTLVLLLPGRDVVRPDGALARRIHEAERRERNGVAQD